MNDALTKQLAQETRRSKARDLIANGAEKRQEKAPEIDEEKVEEGGSVLECVKDEGGTLTDELEHVKRELFYSVAMSIKLNFAMAGKHCNQNIQSLYERCVLVEHQPHKDWNEWIHKQLSRT